MPVMHTAIPCTGNTADQAVNTVHVQLGAAKHLTRPLTVRMTNLGSFSAPTAAVVANLKLTMWVLNIAPVLSCTVLGN
jgi:hypothetical protein